MQTPVKSHGIALTGGIATGKSTVGRILRQLGELVIDADQLSREVTAPGTDGLRQLTQAFGPGILTAGGALDRKALGALVFGDAARRRQLEALTHPLIRAALTARLQAEGLVAQPRRFFYEASLIFETGTEKDFQAVWVTFCAPETQLARVMARDGVDQARAQAVIGSQMPAKDKAARADVVIGTDAPLADIERQVRAALDRTSSGSL